MKNKYIAIMADDSPGLITSILAILKSGNCFVPINPIFPNDRICFILKDCNIEILLTDKTNYEKIRLILNDNPSTSIQHLICIDDIRDTVSKGALGEGDRSHQCYVIYTSGSTGKPKGVPITHQNLALLLYFARDYLGLDLDARVMQNLSYTFDFGIFEILTTILFGGRLYALNKLIISDFSFYRYYINLRQINTLHTTPVFISNLVDSDQEMPSIKLVHLGGEKLTGEVVKNVLNVISHEGRLFNGYGPTETTINCSFFAIKREKGEVELLESIPIGRPSNMHNLYILDKFFNLQPIGAAGELCIAGPGLSAGYLNRPELTAEKFIKNNFNWTSKPYILYRTGDLSRWLPDGNIEFLGRIDHQVKIRGFRIELGEIENCLSLYPVIKDTVVIAREHENGGNYLCAYIVARSQQHLSISQLREFLSKRLPDYMVPAYFIQLDSIPLTPNGKVDRKALPEPDEAFINTGSEYVAPVTVTEKKLASIWHSILSIRRIGINDDFFQVGGDSILVNRCIARIREELQAEIPLRKFFERPFIKALAEEIEKQERQVSSIKKTAREGEIPLSFSQERLWFLQELDSANVAYFVPRVIRMRGKLDVSLMECTFSEIIRRHEILRTVFPTIEGRPVQRIQPPYEFKIPLMNWMGLEKVEQERRIANFLNEEGQRPFDFTHGPLLRVTLLKLKAEEYLFVLTEHHLVHDGWTQGVLLNEVIRIFTAYSEGKGHQMSELPIQYADFAIWQRNHLKGEVLERHLAYWKDKLAGLPPVLVLPSDRPRPPVISGQGGLEIVRLPGTTTIALKQFSRKNRATLFMTMLAAFKTLLLRYTEVEDLCVGTGIANRRYKEMEGMLGMVINTLPLRTQVQGQISFAQCLRRVKETCLEAYQHEETPFGKIVEVMQPERSLSYSPLFQVMFTFMDTPGEELRLPGLELELLPTHNRSAKFDINVVVVPPREQGELEENEAGETLVEWEYNTDIFDAPTILRMVSHYGRLLEEGLGQPEMRISSLSLMSDEVLKQVLSEFNNTETVYPHHKTIHQLFEEQASKTPDHIAVVGHGQTLTGTDKKVSLTYQDLDQHSEGLARILIEKGVIMDNIVGIMMKRRIEMIIGIMGILKSGGAYLPIDPDYPHERINYMLKESCAKLLAVANDKDGEKVGKWEGEKVLLEEIPGSSYPLTFLPSYFLNSSNLAYIIYTSGSTGNPKGVMVEHRTLVNLCCWHNSFYSVTWRDRATKYAGFGFDASVWEIFPYLAAGASLYIVPGEIILDIEGLNRYYEKNGITIGFLPTQVCEQFMELNNNSLRVLLTGGDKLKNYKKKNYRFYNNYGPTENTVVTTSFWVTEASGNIPIGKPIANNQVYILDRNNCLQPVGIPGELCAGGGGIARGYLNQPELTAEKFINNRSYRTPRTYINYKTGDLARWLLDGNIEFLGRIDHQVKIRGFRIELGEIEGRLLKHEHVKEAVVIDRNFGEEKHLCAYIVPSTGEENALGAAELRAYLQGSLPDYMIPSFFIFIERIPLNSNGKADKKALPEPGAGETVKEHSSPRDTIEKKIVEIWSEILKPGCPIGIDDNFFDLGGHSLNATLLTARMHKVFNVKIPLKEFLQGGCIREVAEYIKKSVKEEFIFIEPVEKKEYYPLSPAQNRMYLLNQMDEGSAAYNITTVVTLEGALDTNRLENVFLNLTRRHESLQTSFINIDGEPVQRVLGGREEKNIIEVFLGSHGAVFSKKTPWSPEVIIKSFIRPFDLSKVPLMRVGLIKISENKYILMIDIHHIIADGTSLGILYKEMMALYQGNDLPTLTITYKDYAAWQNNQKNKEDLSGQETYWLEQLAGEIPTLNLPIDYSRPLVQSFEGSRVHFKLSREETGLLKKLARDRGATLYMALLAVCNIWFSKLSGEEDIVIGTPIAGRRHVELQDIVGMLVNTLPLRNYPALEKYFGDFLEEVKERALEAFRNQDYPFENLVEKLSIIRDTSRNPVFDVMFGFQNMEMPAIDTPGLSLRPYEYEIKTAKFDLNLAGREDGDQLTFSLEYSTKLFKEETIREFIGYYKNIIHAICAEPVIRLAEIEIIDEAEKGRILAISTGPTEAIDLDETIHGWFERIVPGKEDKTALVFRERRLTYGELNRRANRLAYSLRRKGVLPGTAAGLMVERSFEIIIGMLGIMKAGGAYLPIDPGLPGQRKQHMIEDGGISVLLTNYDIDEDAACIPGDMELIDTRDEDIWRGDWENPPIVNKGADLVYILFTSGSTGRPKGVMLEHTNLVNLFKYQQKYTIIDTTKVLQFATISFDVSFQEIFTTLLGLGELYLIPVEIRSQIPELFEFISKNKIKTLFLPMSFIKLIFSQDDYIEIFPGSVAHIVTAGEQVIVSDRLRNYVKQHRIHLHNHYGPAETHVVTTLTMNPEDNIPEFPSIGKPVMNTCIYILDKGKHLQPVGIAGELYAGGLQVGRGYRGREEETKEKFSEDFFRKGKLYRTGDLARCLSSGNIEFLGRIDHQVKIRGIRVEPGEIENRLKKISFIEDAVVVVKMQETSDKYLCAYIVLNATQAQGDIAELKLSQLRELLAVDLPDYMIPSYFVRVDKIPLTPSGKIDRKALPEPVLKTGEKYKAPRGEIEKKMVAIWSRILGLEQEQIGIEDNFFQLGGHSLKATLMVSKIHKEFDVKIPLADIFKRPTVRGLVEYIKNAGTSAFVSIKPAPLSDYYPLSSPQRRLYILQQMDKSGTVYNLPAVLELEGMPGMGKLEEIFNKLITRHESLRTSFHMVEEKPVQQIHSPNDIQFTLLYVDASLTVDSLSRQVSQLIRAFDLSTAPLFRVGLLKLAEQKYIMVVDMHHIVSDGTSLGVLVQEFMALYSGQELPALRLHYKDYAVFQGGSEVQELLHRQAEFWLKQFQEVPPKLELPLDYPRPAVQSFEGTAVYFKTGVGELKAIKLLALEENVTLYMILMAVYAILLSRLSAQEEIVIGAPVAGRRQVEVASIIGMFVNTLALRIFPVGNKTFQEFLAELKQATLDAFENQEYPFENLVEQVVTDRDAGRNPLFDVVFILQNQEIPTLEIPGLKLKPFPFETKRAKFDLTLSAVEVKSKSGEEDLKLYLEYCTQLFRGETIERFIVYFKNIIRGITENKAGRILDLEIIPEEEKNRMLYDFNNTQAEYPADKTIQQLFEEQASKTPDHISVVGHGQTRTGTDKKVSLTYQDLNQHSEGLARILIEKGVLADDIVAIMIERSIDLITGILSILKAGSAYLPIDPEYPKDRIGYMLKESRAAILFTDKNEEEIIVNCKPINTPKASFHHSSFIIHNSNQIAYVMYTSGSTGQPKGSMVTHRNVVRLVKNTNFVPLNEKTRILQTGSPVFDATTFEIWGSLLNGGQLVLVNKEDILNANRLAEVLVNHRINTLWLSAPLFNQLQHENMELFAPLGYLLVGGDVLTPAHINRVRLRFPLLKIINGYGPTENTTFSTTYLIEKEFEQNIPIGRPIANSTAYIYDKYNRLTPMGVTGELVVGGDGVALGYLNNPELTAEKFINNWSYRTHRTYIFYKTGDLARWLNDGNIEYLGRSDQQVKIRGFRIELEEIEKRLLTHGAVKEAVVVCRESGNGNKYLCAYISVGTTVNRDSFYFELKEHLAHVLPDYMLPSYFVLMDRVPLTANGKVDRKALPEPETMIEAEHSYTAPCDWIETMLAETWAEVLEIDKDSIGRDANFFNLGGHSLKAVSLISRIEKRFKVKISLTTIFKSPTIREMAKHIVPAERYQPFSIAPAEEKEFYPLTPLQQKLFVLNQLQTIKTAYNMPSFLTVEGALDREKFERVFSNIICRHATLRTSFIVVDRGPVQRVHREVNFELEYDTLTGSETEAEHIKRFIRPFDLSRAPLFRVGLLKISEEKHILMFDMHHIISDGTSAGILVRNMVEFYKGKELPPLKLQYKDFSQWLNGSEGQEMIAAQETYWLDLYKGKLPAANMYTDYPRPPVQSFAGDSISFSLGEELSLKIRGLMAETGTTLFIVLLAGLNILLSAYTGQEDIVVGAPIAGRMSPDLNDIIALFINTLPTRNYPRKDKTFKEFLAEVKENTIKAFENQLYPFATLLEKLNIEKDLSRNPLFDVELVVLNMDIPALEMEGLSFTPYPQKLNISQVDIDLFVSEQANDIHMSLLYCTDILKKETVMGFIEFFKKILSAVVANKDIKLSDILPSDLTAVRVSALKDDEEDFGY